jgi:hypothetical protein
MAIMMAFPANPFASDTIVELFARNLIKSSVEEEHLSLI